jgi:hypothetical protein
VEKTQRYLAKITSFPHWCKTGFPPRLWIRGKIKRSANFSEKRLWKESEVLIFDFERFYLLTDM